jgi:predicted phosphodiesterase
MYFYLFAEADVDAVFAGHLHDNRTAEYEGIPMLTTTSSGYQLGDAPSSVRLITVSGRKVKEELVPIF